MADIEFYDVKTRKKVSLPKSAVTKVTYTGKDGKLRYGLRGKTSDNRVLNKFVSKADWESLDVPAEQK